VYSAVELKKLKKDFVNVCKVKPPKSKDIFKDLFVEFVNTCGLREND